MDFEKIKHDALREFNENRLIGFAKSSGSENTFNLPPEIASGVEEKKMMIRLAFEASSIMVEEYHKKLSSLLKEKGINLDDLD